MDKKYFICDFARSNSGKTSTLNLFVNKLKLFPQVTHTDSNALYNGDVWELFEYDGKKICVVTSGDNSDDMKEWFEEAFEAKADIVVCASRSKGKTIDCVNEYAQKGGYDVIWFSNFYSNTSKSIIDTLNACTVDSLLHLIEKLLNIKFLEK